MITFDTQFDRNMAKIGEVGTAFSRLATIAESFANGKLILVQADLPNGKSWYVEKVEQNHVQ